MSAVTSPVEDDLLTGTPGKGLIHQVCTRCCRKAEKSGAREFALCGYEVTGKGTYGHGEPLDAPLCLLCEDVRRCPKCGRKLD